MDTPDLSTFATIIREALARDRNGDDRVSIYLELCRKAYALGADSRDALYDPADKLTPVVDVFDRADEVDFSDLDTNPGFPSSMRRTPVSSRVTVPAPRPTSRTTPSFPPPPPPPRKPKR